MHKSKTAPRNGTCSNYLPGVDSVCVTDFSSPIDDQVLEDAERSTRTLGRDL